MDVRKQLNSSKNAVDLRNTSKRVKNKHVNQKSSGKSKNGESKKSISKPLSQRAMSAKPPLLSRSKAQSVIAGSTTFISQSLKRAHITPPPTTGLLITAGFLVAFIGATFIYFSMTKSVPTDGGQITEGILGSANSLNPLYAPNNPVDSDVSSILYPQLFTYDVDGVLQPELVQEYEVNQEKTVYTITLKENISWDDKTPISVDDILFTIEKITDPNLESPLRPALTGVEAVRIDDRTLELKRNSSYSPFISTMTFGILPKHIWESRSNDSYRTLEDNFTIVGAGPFKYKSHKFDPNSKLSTLSLEKNPGYFGQKPRIDRLTLQFYTNPQMLIDDFQKGIVDIASYVNLPQDTSNVLTQFIRVPQYFAVFFNTKTPFLKNQPAREALTLAFDKETFLSEVIGEFGEPLDGPLTPYNTYFKPNTSEFNPDSARKILDENGWVDVDGDGIREKDNVKAEITLTSAEGEYVPEFLDKFQAAAKEVGISILTDRQTLASIQENILPERAFDALYIGIGMNIYPDPFIYWHSSQSKSPGLNVSQYSNVNADIFLESARTNTDESVIASSLLQFQEQINLDTPALFLYTPNSPFYVRDYVDNVRTKELVGNSYSSRYLDLINWTIQTKRVWR